MMMTEFGDQKRRDYHHESFISNREDKCSAKKHKSRGSPKERKDKVGERVAKLQQLVSPYGKTDTASVLQEATGYINFLHDQLQVLSAPYIQRGADGNTMQDRECYGLRSRGLCLMPIESTLKIARSNGADLWAPTNNT